MAKGQIQVEIVDTQKCLSAIDEIKKKISKLEGANKVRAIWEYADSFTNNPCGIAGSDVDTGAFPQHLHTVLGDDVLAEFICGIVQEWAQLKGYGHSESKEGLTSG
jgi:hypothetical protein